MATTALTPADHCYMKGHTSQWGTSCQPGDICVVCGATIPPRTW